MGSEEPSECMEWIPLGRDLYILSGVLVYAYL